MAGDVDPTALRREARERKHAYEAAIQDAKERTKDRSYDPWSASLKQSRMALRTVYVALLMNCTFTRAAQHVDTMIWYDTTYSVISYLRSRLAHMEKELASAPGGKNCNNSGGKSGADVPRRERKSAKAHAYASKQQELQNYITHELSFYQDVVVRLVQKYALDDVCGVLGTLGINTPKKKGPKDADAPAALGAAPAHRHQLYETLQRLLTCMGDLHRYRELHAAASVASDKRQRVHYNFTRAVLFYHEAHILQPDNGNPSNQLAVVATCVGDVLGSVYQYYRALCVRVPFENARFNLQRLFEKALHAWSSSARRDDVLVAWRQAALEDCPARRAHVPSISARWESMSTYFSSLVDFHALCFLRADLDTACVLNDAALRHLLVTVDTHELRAVDYLRMLITGLCASWTARLCRAPLHERLAFAVGAPQSPQIDAPALDEHVRRAWETLLVCHVLGLLSALLAVNRHELMHMMRSQSTDTPKLLEFGRVLRRTLPSVRIGLKWVKGHLEYIASCRTHAATAADELQRAADAYETPSLLATDAVARLACIQRSVDTRIASFWNALIDFVNLLRAAYPFDLLPNAKEVEESGRVPVHIAEDDDLRYLGPLRRVMHPVDESSYAVPELEHRSGHADAHSDYARVTDVMIDVKVMAESDACGLLFDDRRALFVLRGSGDDADDPIELAMRAMDVSRHIDDTWPAPSAAASSAWLATASPNTWTWSTFAHQPNVPPTQPWDTQASSVPDPTSPSSSIWSTWPK